MSNTADDSKQLEQAARAKMVRCALRHWVDQACDWRVGVLLGQAGLLKEHIPLPSLPAHVLAALHDPDDDRRTAGPPGPVVLLKAGNNHKHGEALAVLDLICAPHREVREAALAHFERELHRDGSYLTPLCQSLVEEYADAIRADDTTRWLGAAMRLEKELDGDVKLNLAGFRQALVVDVHQLQQHHWTRLLRPAVASLLSIREDAFHALKPRESFDTAIRQILDQAKTPLDLLALYSKQYGHLPLQPDLSIGTVLKRWATINPGTDLCSALQDWRSSTRHPLRTLEACQAMISNPIAISQGKEQEFWNDIVKIATLSPRNDCPSIVVALLSLEADLVRHYFRYLETRTVGIDVDRLANLSWWMARAVSGIIGEHASTVGDPAKAITSIRRESLQSELQISRALWQAAHPRSGGASIRFATLYAMQPRALALLLGMKDRLGELPVSALKSHQRDAITQTFRSYLAGCFPMRAIPRGEAVWAYDRPLSSSFKEWVAATQDDASSVEHGSVISFCDAISDSRERLDLLRDLGAADEPTRTFLACLFHVLAFADTDEGSQLWEMVADGDWCKGCLKQLSEDGLQALFDGIMELPHRVEDARNSDLAHLFANEVESAIHDERRRSSFFALTVLASANSGTVSAIRRLVRGPVSPDRREAISSWRSHLASMLPVAPPVMAGHLRDVLSSLRAT